MEHRESPPVRKASEYVYWIDQKDGMRVPVKIFTSDKLLPQLQSDSSLHQASNVATLPGIVYASIIMPDAHQGYGFSIGGVAAFDEDEGIISPGGVGYDINCGVRILATNLTKENVAPKMQELLDHLYKVCPVGVGAEGIRLSDKDLRDVCVQGARWAVAQGHGTEEDLRFCEAEGCLPEARPEDVPKRAMQRGQNQLGTVGAGNHFIEIQYVENIFSPDVAKAFGITGVGQVVAMIHCGSRGFGHQICTEFVRMMEDAQPDLIATIADRELMYAPLSHPLAKQYWGAMNCAANFAFANRHILGNNIRKAFHEVFGADTEVRTVYDVCHNIAKRERHTVDGKEKSVVVHRKGATRAFPAGHPEIPDAYRAFGQPVLIPGSMGTASYILVGQEGSMRESFGSTAHGAGRTMSRVRAKRDYPAETVRDDLEKYGVTIKAATLRGISEEAPGAYKDVDEVIRVSDEAGIAKRVARLRPIGVIKG